MPVAVEHYRTSRPHLPGTAVHLAVKANPEPALLRALRRPAAASTWPARPRGARRARGGAAPDELVYSNPVKRRSDIAFAARHGVRLFVVDSPETVKVAAAAPGNAVLCRLVTSGAGSDWPLSRKVRLLHRRGRADPGRRGGAGPGARRGVLPRGLAAALSAPGVGTTDRRRGPGLRQRAAPGPAAWLLDLGGGSPPGSPTTAPPAARRWPEYGAAIDRHLTRSLRADGPRTAPHAGRARPRDRRRGRAAPQPGPGGDRPQGGTRWVFLDMTSSPAWSGTIEAIRYPVDVPRP